MIVRFDAINIVFIITIFTQQSSGLNLRAAKTRKQLAEAILRVYLAKDGTRLGLKSEINLVDPR